MAQKAAGIAKTQSLKIYIPEGADKGQSNPQGMYTAQHMSECAEAEISRAVDHNAHGEKAQHNKNHKPYKVFKALTHG